MVSLLYALAVVILFWVPAGIFLHGFYSTRYDTPNLAQFNLNRDMKTWAPVVTGVLALLVPEGTLVFLATIGLAFEAYLIYADDEDGAYSKFKRFTDDD